MPYLICEKSKQRFKVNTEVCLQVKCQHLKMEEVQEGGEIPTCNFKPISKKRIEKRKKARGGS